MARKKKTSQLSMNHDIIASNRGLLWRRMPTKHRYQGKDETALSAEATREKKKKKFLQRGSEPD